MTAVHPSAHDVVMGAIWCELHCQARNFFRKEMTLEQVTEIIDTVAERVVEELKKTGNLG